MGDLKVLVLGSSGMLGHKVVAYLEKFENLEVYNFSKQKKVNADTIILDIMDSNRFEESVKSIKPNIIINCIGILINGSKNIASATYINAYFPNFLADICNSSDCKLIHISTDCVFSGRKGNYKENDLRDGYDVYARTKILGEINDNNNLTIRSSIIGPELKKNGEGLFDWFAKQEGEINGYKNSIWSGVTTLEMAKAIKWAIDKDIKGIYHVTNNQAISKYNLLKLFKKYTNKNIEICAVDNKKIDKSFIDTRQLIDYKIPPYNKMIEDMIKDLKKDLFIYPEQYKSI